MPKSFRQTIKRDIFRIIKKLEKINRKNDVLYNLYLQSDLIIAVRLRNIYKDIEGIINEYEIIRNMI